MTTEFTCFILCSAHLSLLEIPTEFKMATSACATGHPMILLNWPITIFCIVFDSLTQCIILRWVNLHSKMRQLDTMDRCKSIILSTDPFWHVKFSWVTKNVSSDAIFTWKNCVCSLILFSSRVSLFHNYYMVQWISSNHWYQNSTNIPMYDVTVT